MPIMSLFNPSTPRTSTTPCRLCIDAFSESLQVPTEPTPAVLVPSAQHPLPAQPSAPTAGFEPSAPVPNGSSELQSLPSHPMITRAKAVGRWLSTVVGTGESFREKGCVGQWWRWWFFNGGGIRLLILDFDERWWIVAGIGGVGV
ncbi:hypothetical protein F0562_012299 [Nyssa sinensis]|uniref:Uncharacterized protein n=1 Tax=Nyssa sinensis TaxID=561372 RepID=A0A5J4ZUT8_9ASTE|nr:hypothetical protein F0562_012299 [Nyssa sinensis]